MKRLVLIPIAVWLTGCVTPPPLPKAPPFVPGIPTPPPLSGVLVHWTFQLGDKHSTYRDTLEASASVSGPWGDVEGPYEIDFDSYRVPIPVNQPTSFFRVRRERGSPNVN